MSNNYRESSIKTIPFSGQKEYFLICIEKILAKALQKGCLNILTGVETLPKKREYKEAVKKNAKYCTAEDNLMIEQYSLGMSAYSDLILSMDTAKAPGRVTFGIVKQSKTSDNPNGNLYLAL